MYMHRFECLRHSESVLEDPIGSGNPSVVTLRQQPSTVQASECWFGFGFGFGLGCRV